MQRYAISVVVATYNRADRLPRLMDCLAAQVVEGDFEVVLVDDASSDTTSTVIGQLQSAAQFPLRVVRLEQNGGPAVARNAGWRVAGAPLVAFTDDDCMPTAGWLEALVDALGDADIAQGMTVIDPDRVRGIGPFGHTVEVLREDGFYETCNIAYRRALLERVDGFDERFGYYAEDTDLAWRGMEAGAKTAFVPTAVVRHEVRPSNFAAHLREIRRREGLVRAIKRHPQIRRKYMKGVFFSPSHPWALAWTAAASVTAVKRRSPVAWTGLTMASAGYARSAVHTLHGPARRRQWPAVLPLALAADLVEVAILARASLRYRTLFL